MSYTFAIKTPTTTSQVHIGTDHKSALSQLQAALLAEGKRALVVTDEGVRAAWSTMFTHTLKALPQLSIPAGESTKSMHDAIALLDSFTENKLDRSSAIIIIGGGVIGDLAGFAAAVFLRGIDYYSVPTTLLAMVDSALGGKVGVNLPAGKNLVGAFHHPQTVIIDPSLLATLPAREFNAGMAEVIKYGLIKDLALWQQLTTGPRLQPDDPALVELIYAACRCKADIVMADERETAMAGGRACLNLGHTFAHAIETVAGYGEYAHGEAVAIGLVMAARLAELLGFLPQSAVDQVREVVSRYDLPITLHQPLAVQTLMRALQQDKKIRRGELRFIVPKAIGQAEVIDGVDQALIQQLWREFNAK